MDPVQPRCLPPSASLQHVLNLKTIAINAGVEKPITAKTGRHTFATFFLAKTQQLTTLKELLGHTHIEETLIYAHVLDESKINGVACFNSIQ